jgi:hypothetical protein
MQQNNSLLAVAALGTQKHKKTNKQKFFVTSPRTKIVQPFMQQNNSLLATAVHSVNLGNRYNDVSISTAAWRIYRV